MKLSKRSWLLLAVGVSIIAFASLGAVRSQQASEQDQLYEELSLAELKLSRIQLKQLSSRQKELEKQLSQTISQSETTNVVLPQPTGSIVASDTLFDTAAACGVKVIAISSSGLATDEVEGTICYVLTLAVRVEGDVSNLISCITKLNDDLTNGVVKSVQISIPEATGEEKPSANIQLVIYTYYQGD